MELKSALFALLASPIIAAFTSCNVSENPTRPAMPPQQAISQRIDLQKFMGDWYVIAHIPTFIEKKAYNAVERYEMKQDGTIATTFTFNQGSYDGPVKTYHPTGSIHNSKTNAEWRMQFIWPFKSAYLITHLDAAYQTTIIGVPDRSYVWIMARTKTIPDSDYNELVNLLKSSGHDISKLRRVPQR